MKHLVCKTIIAVLAALILLAGTFVVLSVSREYHSVTSQMKASTEKLDQLGKTIVDLEAEEANSSSWFTENLQNNMKFMKDALSALFEEGEYNGPKTFREGLVVQLDDNSVIYPQSMTPGLIELTADMIRAGSETDASGTIPISNGKIYPAGEGEQDVLLTFGKIADDYYYVDWTLDSEYQEYLDIHSGIQDALNAAENSFGGAFVLLEKTTNNGVETLNPQKASGSFQVASLVALQNEFQQLTQEGMDAVTIDGVTYYGAAKQISDTQYLVFLLPLESIFSKSEVATIVIVLILMTISAAVICYMISLQSYIKKHKLTEDQAEKWEPKRVLRKVISTGLICLVITFGVAAFLEALTALQSTTEKANTSLTKLSDMSSGKSASDSTMQKFSLEVEKKDGEEKGENTDQNEEAAAKSSDSATASSSGSKTSQTSVSGKAQSEEEEWYVYYGEQIASLLSQYPQFWTSEKLQEFCNDLAIDYLMVFDGNGDEILCNKPYSYFKLGKGQGENSEDFLRLLQGVPSIVHSESTDEITGLKRQFIGVTTPGTNSYEPHGALILSILPERTRRTTENSVASSPLEYLNGTDVIYFGADSESGAILYSGNGGLFKGLNIANLGLEKETLKDGYMDFANLSGTDCYVVTKASGSTVYYCITAISGIYSSLLVQSLLSAGCFLVLGLVLVLILFLGFTKKSFDKYADIIVGDQEEELFQEEKQKEEQLKKKKWKGLLPEELAGKVFHVLLFFSLVSIAVIEIDRAGQLAYGDVSLIQFILTGNWMRGLNMFSVSGIILLIIFAFLIVSIFNWFYSFLPGIIPKKGETIRRLLASFTTTIAVLAVIYFSMEFLGFNPGAILAGLGVVGLALSLGAKDMIADIFAGINIVFEDSFQVGDFVKIGNYRGRVLTIGIRTTKLIDASRNVKVMNNKDIKDVINMSRFDTSFRIEIRIPVTQSLPEIREIMERELPKIAEKSELIQGGPYYFGVTDMQGVFAKHVVVTECAGKNLGKTKAYVYEEVVEMLKRENVELRYNPSINIQTGEDENIKIIDEGEKKE